MGKVGKDIMYITNIYQVYIYVHIIVFTNTYIINNSYNAPPKSQSLKRQLVL